MCKWGTVTKVKFCKPKTKIKTRKMEGYVDSCIAPIVQALNNAGIRTLASCCGHGHIPGNIILEVNDKALIIFSSWKNAYKYYKKVGLNIDGKKIK